MKLFKVMREHEGQKALVGEGVVFSTGKCVLSWFTTHMSLAIYDDINALVQIHEMDGKTKIEFVTPAPLAVVP